MKREPETLQNRNVSGSSENQSFNRWRLRVPINALAVRCVRIVLLLERDRKVHVRPVRRAENRLPRRKHGFRAELILANHTPQVAEAMARQPEPERALLEELANSRRRGARIREGTRDPAA